jgi:hypothetical protein
MFEVEKLVYDCRWWVELSNKIPYACLNLLVNVADKLEEQKKQIDELTRELHSYRADKF